MLVVFNATTAFFYAVLALRWSSGESRARVDLERLYHPTAWDETQGALVAAPIAGALAWWVLLRWSRRRRAEANTLFWVEAAVSGAGLGIFAVVLASMLAPGLTGLGELLAGGTMSSTPLRIALWPLAALALAPFGALASLGSLFVSLPVIVIGGPLNAILSLGLLRWAESRGGSGAA